LIINTDLKDAGVLWHLLVRPKAVGGTIWSICHSEPRVGSFISLQIADGVVKDCLMAAAQTFFDSGCIQVAGLHPHGGRDVLTTLQTYFVPPIHVAYPFLDELYLPTRTDDLRGASRGEPAGTPSAQFRLILSRIIAKEILDHLFIAKALA
jgi:hypothetical protein